ncbi:unnamed protein product [Dracunculus medinensis]|uniref:CCA tRNA nucleotidyltransferase 1, mitochondrial n=1 Tax=Dracunculus medinensis TaxID=318479 RepID=A0A0N4UGK5_DRAME|nr:unnamed protein product [Dracunculus medinensis]
MGTAKHRTPITMKINSPQLQLILTPELRILENYFKSNNFQLRIAGGAVRDLLMGMTPADVDFATDATPEQMKEIFMRENVRIFNKKGEEHGTVSCRINDKENFEITTLRVDILCDGRRAEVEFTTDWQLDANRRDLTINSLFLDTDGTVIDYFGGINDINLRRVVFVGNARQRIQEDYLRILRYFRFFGRVALSCDAHDESTLQAIIENKDGLDSVSGERIWSELKKICVGRLGGEVVTIMLEKCHLSSLLGLPPHCEKRLAEFRKIYDSNIDRFVQPMTLISSLFSNLDDLNVFHLRCKLSNIERLLSQFIIEKRDEMMKTDRSSKNRQFPEKMTLDRRTKVLELAKYCMVNNAVLEELDNWHIPEFPVNGKDLLNFISSGPIMSEVLTTLFIIWRKVFYS